MTAEPPRDCQLCPRLAAFRAENAASYPEFHSAPVPSFGQQSARLLVVGLAPGLKGANRTGRPFTGDFAGDLLYRTLAEFGLSRGTFDARPDDGLMLVDCMITNAVRCVPPQNKPETIEIKTCNSFLSARIESLPNLRVIIALGGIAHAAVLTALALRKSAHAFKHGAQHALPGNLTLFDSYHCSRYNTNTGVLTEAMFLDVFRAATAAIATTPVVLT